jgi:hypothetical protein
MTRASIQVHWVSFYANCTHTLHSVTRGYRLALAYHLYAPSAATMAIAPPSQQDALAGFGVLAARWTEHATVKKLVHFCDGKAECWEQLTGSDKALAQCLQESGAFDVFLVKVDVQETETMYDSDEDGHDTAGMSIQASLWISREGIPCNVCKVKLDSSEFVQGRSAAPMCGRPLVLVFIFSANFQRVLR